MDKQAFATWLQERKTSTFRTRDWRCCPIGRYLDCTVAADHFRAAYFDRALGEWRPLPRWVVPFVREIDRFRTVSGWYCLVVLRMVGDD